MSAWLAPASLYVRSSRRGVGGCGVGLGRGAWVWGVRLVACLRRAWWLRLWAWGVGLGRPGCGVPAAGCGRLRLWAAWFGEWRARWTTVPMWGWRTCCGPRDRPAVGWHVRPDGWVLGPLDAHVNPMGGAWAGVPMLHVSGPAAHERVSATTCRAQVTETLRSPGFCGVVFRPLLGVLL